MQTKKNASQVEQQRSASDTRYAGRMEALVELARTYPNPLAERGFGPDKAAEMSSALLTYNGAHQAWLYGRGNSAQQRALLGTVVAETLGFRQELSVALKLLAKRGGPAAPPVRKRLSLGSSPQRCLAWMGEVRSSVEALDGALSAFMIRPLARFNELHAKLSTAVASKQQAAGGELTRLRAALSKSRAELEGLAELLRFSGRLAFKGNRELLRRLSRSAGQHHRKTVTPPPPVPSMVSVKAAAAAAPA